MPVVSTLDVDALAARCRTIAGSADGALAWEWDGVFSAALAAFDASHSQAVREALGDAMGTSFSADTIATASAPIQQIVRGHGGLRAGQELWARTDAGPLLYCAWWPWGGGARISIRVGVEEAENFSSSTAEAGLRNWFRIA